MTPPFPPALPSPAGRPLSSPALPSPAGRPLSSPALPTPAGRAGPPCPVCDAPTRPNRVVRGYAVVRCPACAHRTLADPPGEGHAEAHFGADYFTAGGAGYADYLAEADLVRAGGRFYANIVSRWVRRPGRVFDAGAAAGFTLRGFSDRGWHGSGVEPNPDMAARAGADGFDVRPGTLEGVDGANLAGSFDAVTLIQVAAHLADPAAAARAVARLLRPGGVVVVETWDPDSLTARLTGDGWHEWSPPTVRHWFTPRSLRTLLRRAGLAPVAKGARVKWVQAGHAADLLAHAAGGGALTALARRVPRGWTLPYPADDLYWLVARRVV